MPWFLPIASLALAAGGTAASMAGQADVADQQNKLVGAELQRQKKYEDQTGQLYQQSKAASTPEAATQQIGQGQQQALDAYQKIQQTPLSIAPSAAISPTSISTQDNAARQGLSNSAQAGIQGYKNFDLQQWLKDLQTNSTMGAVNGLARGSQAILPFELQGAHSPLTGIGSLLGAFGSLAGAAGGASSGAGASSNWMSNIGQGTSFGN